MSRLPLDQQIASLRTPVVLAIVVFTLAHHLVSWVLVENWHILSESLVYGITMPLAAWILLGWLERSARAGEEAREKERSASAGLARRTQQIEALYSAGQLLAGSRSIDELADPLLALACGITGASTGVLVLFAEASAAPVIAATGADREAMRAAVLQDLQDGPCLTCPASPHCALAHDIVCRPILCGAEVIGLLRLERPLRDSGTEQSLDTLLSEMAATWMARRAESRAWAAFRRAGHGFRNREDLSDILERFLLLVRQALNVSDGAIYRLRPGSDPIRVAGTADSPLPEDFSHPGGDTVQTRQGGRQVIAIAERDSRVALTFSTLRPLGHRDLEQLRIIASESAFLLDMADTLSDVSWEERQRVARELHDGLAQTLAHLNLQAGRLSTEMQAKRFDTAETMLQDVVQTAAAAYQEVRHTTDDLRLYPRYGERTGSFLRRIIAPIAARGSVDIALVDRDDIPVPQDVLAQLARILQEALNNALRHGQPRHLRVSVEGSRTGIELTVADDGRGFAVEGLPPDGHHGLAVMRERVQVIGGRFKLESIVGEGTTLRVSVPLSSARRKNSDLISDDPRPAG